MPALMQPPIERVEPTEDRVYRLSIDQYHEMIRAGILAEGEPIELLDGQLVRKMSKNPPHALSTQLTRVALERLVPDGWFVNVQEPIEAAGSEPEPDVSVVRGNRRDYAARHPAGSQVALAVEVAETSLSQDRTSKKRIYAQANVPEYWIVNLSDRRVERHFEPVAGEYRRRELHGVGAVVPVVIGGAEVGRIAVSDVLP